MRAGNLNSWNINFIFYIMMQLTNMELLKNVLDTLGLFVSSKHAFIKFDTVTMQTVELRKWPTKSYFVGESCACILLSVQHLDSNSDVWVLLYGDCCRLVGESYRHMIFRISQEPRIDVQTAVKNRNPFAVNWQMGKLQHVNLLKFSLFVRTANFFR
jgi:hypothetical protein